uniref:hypothetical protein n=1 Tax=Cephaloticoccus sp. TaxID=1985742 RepID=UPI004048F3BE
MDDNDTKENPSSDFNKLDLNQLQSFSFGTQWTQDKSSPGEKREQSDRPRREDRRDGPAAPRRDRRGFRKPAGGGAEPSGDRRDGGGERPAYQGGRPPRREFSGGPRGEGRFEGRGAPQDRGPYDSPVFAASFYPEDTSFNALAKTIRSSYRTIELFEIARTVVGKNDRFIVVLSRKPGRDGADKQPLYISLPDGLPFESEEAVINHVMGSHLGLFFDTAEVEVDPPKGNFQVINKCGVTGELIGPPNYHRYNQMVQQHFDAKVQRMSPEAFRARIESVRDPEVVAQWLEKMKKVTRYTWKTAAVTKPAVPAATTENEAPAEEAPVAETPTDTPEATLVESAETPAVDTAPAASPEAAAEVSTTPIEAAAPDIAFDSLDDARMHLLANARHRIYKTVETARFHGHLIETLPMGEIRRAVEGALERQRRFPLDTANGLRGRLRREHFTIFKKGSKGISYVCAVKRKFRTHAQTFADSIGALIFFIETHPMIKVSELPAKFCNIQQPKAAAPAPEGTAETPAPAAPELTVEQKEKYSRMQSDLRWLVMEGYVTEFIDGRLFAAPPMAESNKQSSDDEENDPESYPDIPADAPDEAPAPSEAKAAAPVPSKVQEPAVAVEPEKKPVATESEGETPAHTD